MHVQGDYIWYNGLKVAKLEKGLSTSEMGAFIDEVNGEGSLSDKVGELEDEIVQLEKALKEAEERAQNLYYELALARDEL